MTSTKSRSRGEDSSNRPELAVKMDYSTIYKENDELEEDLEEHLDELHKTRYRTWVEKRQQLKVIRAQVEVIMRLRAAVNARKPGDSIELVSSSRPRRARRPTSLKKTPEDPADDDPLDVKEMAKTSKTQMRINQEKEKFSSKNLFNVRRKNRGLGSMDTMGSTEGRLFTKRVSLAAHRTNETSFNDDNSYNNRNETSTRPLSADRPKTACNLGPKNYMQQTVSSRKGSRPKTAIGITEVKGQNTLFDSPLPSRMPSATRCRSRRELELLSRQHLKEATGDVPKQVAETPAWEVVKESQRNVKLQELRSQGKELQIKVDRFLNDLHSFNTKHNVNNKINGEIYYE